jgi:glycosyltransferase involved in cell wall biosynthesis
VNVLFIHEVDWLNKVVFDIHTLAESLSLRGHRIYAIDYASNWRRQNPADLGTFKTREIESVSRALAGAKVTLIRPGFIRISGLSRVSAAFTHWREIRKTIREKKIDVIVLYGAATNGLQAISAARKRNIPVVFRSIDILNQLVVYPVLRPFTRILEKKVYARADMILTLTPSLSKYVAGLGAREDRIRPLPMPVDTGIFCPSPVPTELRSRWGIKKTDSVILYMGTLFDFSGLDLIIPRLPEIVSRVPGAKLLIVGDGPQREQLEGIIAETGVTDRVIITGFQPYETMPYYINMAAICLNPFRITGATREIFPGKIVQYLACAKAIVATPLPGLIAVTPGEEQGLVFADTPGAMAEKLVEILKDAVYRKRLERNGLEYVKKVHSYENIAAQLETRLKEAIELKTQESNPSLRV